MEVYIGAVLTQNLPGFIFFSRQLPPSTIWCQLLSSVDDWSYTMQALKSFLSFSVGLYHSVHAGTVFQTCFIMSLQVQASISFRGSSERVSIHLGRLSTFPHHLFVGKKSIFKKSQFPKEVECKSQSLAGYICDDLVQELLFVTVMCGQPDPSVLKNKNT